MLLIQYLESSRALFFYTDLPLADKIKYAGIYNCVLLLSCHIHHFWHTNTHTHTRKMSKQVASPCIQISATKSFLVTQSDGKDGKLQHLTDNSWQSVHSFLVKFDYNKKKKDSKCNIMCFNHTFKVCVIWLTFLTPCVNTASLVGSLETNTWCFPNSTCSIRFHKKQVIELILFKTNRNYWHYRTVPSR